MIPKIIHYCWFGGNPLPELAQKCIESWKKYLPDYEIKEWNESNFDFSACEYAREAYEAKKWAFVSDYARFKILYNEGGIYFDTDVEVIKDMTHIIEAGAFMGLEKRGSVNPGLGLAAEAEMPIYGEIIEHYENSRFLNDDGSLNLTTIVERTTEVLKKHGLLEDNILQNVAGVNIYPTDYFNPIDMNSDRLKVTDNTVSIHHYMASWCDSASKRRGKIYALLYRMFGKSFADFVRKLFGKKKK